MRVFIVSVMCLLSACGPDPQATVAPVKVVSEPLTRPNLNVPAVDPVNLRDVTWMVLTPENAQTVFDALAAEGKPLVLFAVTEQGQKNIQINNANLLRLTLQQQAAINGYKKYYIVADGVIYQYNQEVTS